MDDNYCVAGQYTDYIIILRLVLEFGVLIIY